MHLQIRQVDKKDLSCKPGMLRLVDNNRYCGFLKKKAGPLGKCIKMMVRNSLQRFALYLCVECLNYFNLSLYVVLVCIIYIRIYSGKHIFGFVYFYEHMCVSSSYYVAFISSSVFNTSVSLAYVYSWLYFISLVSIPNETNSNLDTS